jgi:hypothetical protein
MRIQWEIGERVRCDLFAYAAVNLDGKRSIMRIFPSGSKQGRIETEELRSAAFRTHYGTRVIFITHPGDDWEDHPWRCVRMCKDTSVPATGEQRIPGIRIPDLDLLDEHTALKTDKDFQSSYDYVSKLADGTSWTFGRGGKGGLKGKVRLIRIEREELAATAAIETPANMAMIALAKRYIENGGEIRDAVLHQLVDGGLSVEEADGLLAKHL